MPDKTHRRLLAGYLGTLIVTLVAFVALGVLLFLFVSDEFAAYVAGFGSVVAWLGIAHSQRRTSAATPVAQTSRSGPELWILPVLAVAIPAYFIYRLVGEYPETNIITISLAVSAVGFFWAILSGCRSIARATSRA